MSEDTPPERKAVIDYNVRVFQKAVRAVFPRIETIEIISDPRNPVAIDGVNVKLAPWFSQKD
jgi:hypothetical protein